VNRRIKLRYKITDVKEIPADRGVVRLGDVAETKFGGIHERKRVNKKT